MKIYLAGSSHTPVKELKEMGVKNKLYSFHGETTKAIQWGGEGLMLDSGAYSVFTRGVTINIDQLIEFINFVKPDAAIQLDVIGDSQKTYENYVYMKQKIPNVLPVVHFNMSDSYISKMVDSTDYLLLGGLVSQRGQWKLITEWLDYLYTKYKLHTKKVHLLGITKKNLLERYPAYSSDSTTWLSGNRYPQPNYTMGKINQKNKDYYELEKDGFNKIRELEQHITKLWESRGIKWD